MSHCARCGVEHDREGRKYCEPCAALCIKCFERPKLTKSYCAQCHWQMIRQRRETSNPVQRQRHLVRRKVANLLRRGKLQKGTCEICATDQDIWAYFPSVPPSLDTMIWLCRKHHFQMTEQVGHRYHKYDRAGRKVSK